MELIVDRISKQYQNKIAVDRISLTFTKGIYGLLGANGAGKTTFMRMICGVLRSDSGTITMDGMDVTTEEYRSWLGYLPQDFGYYPEFTGMDFLLYMAVLKGMTKPQARRRAKELLELVALTETGSSSWITHRGPGSQGTGAVPQYDTGTWERKHCPALYTYRLRYRTYR